MEDKMDKVRRWIVPSFTQRNSRYVVSLYDNGTFDCTCMRFVMHPTDGDCKHITAVKRGDYKPMAEHRNAQVTVSLYTWDCPDCGFTNNVTAFRVDHIHNDSCSNCGHTFDLMK
jgi:ribosomal protein S27AE